MIDMTGWVMAEHGVPDSRLTVLYRAPQDKKGEAKWVCQCSCGNTELKIVSGSRLRNGETKSCGCLARELKIARLSKENEYNIDGEYGIGYTTNTHDIFYFDIEDFNLIKQYHWQKYVNKGRSNHIDLRAYYINKDGVRKCILMHQLVTGKKKMDHENQNPMDNRKSNLRPATSQQNSANSPLQKNNKSGFTGVYWHKHNQKWIATIRVDYGKINLGSFNNKYDAVITRLQAEKKYFGEFAPQRHLFEEYGIN